MTNEINEIDVAAAHQFLDRVKDIAAEMGIKTFIVSAVTGEAVVTHSQGNSLKVLGLLQYVSMDVQRSLSQPEKDGES